MKKIFLFVTICIIALTNLTSCDPTSIYFQKETYIGSVEKIELVKYNNDNYEMVDPTKVDLKFDFSKVEQREVLDESKIEEFLIEYEKVIFHIKNESVNEPTGYCLLWYLTNGNFIVFSCTFIEGEDRAYDMVAEFSEDCKFLRQFVHFASFPHHELILDEFFESYVCSSLYENDYVM